MTRRQILVTSALPYVNGHIHIGHLVEYVQTDIWVRFQRLRGHEVRYFCADDTHGTATMMRARERGIEPEALLSDMSRAHQRDFADFSVDFDHFGSTHSPSNRTLVEGIWKSLRDAGHVEQREVTQLYDAKAGVFLADRFVKGSCPRCATADQYGDNCDACGAVYRPEELRDPVSTLSGATPEVRSAPHFFVTLENFHDFLDTFTRTEGRLQPEIANWLEGSFLSEPLRDWDVSRPAPYFGFEIPDAPGHYFYVWVDAPVGYMSATWDWCQKTGEDFDRWWRNPDCEIQHFIGKDIAYFHTLFWPAMLEASGHPLPRRVQVHGFLTVNGEKMSKRRGTFAQGDVHPGAHVSGSPRSRLPPLLLRQQALRRRGGHRPQSRRVRCQGRRRSRGQGRQPGESHGALHEGLLALRDLSRGRRALRRCGPRGRRDRGRLRGV
jgi:methionyl-tRNA synthetase